jgi:methanogenic corrinoid protein MtbC1
MSETTDLQQQPIYNIRSVSQKTNISPETLRAWERRYGFPDPYRNPKGYRLYSEDEIAGLNWLRQQTESGMTIGQAVKLLNQLKESGQDPIHVLPRRPTGQLEPFQSLDKIQKGLMEALLDLDEPRATELLNTAYAQHAVSDVLMDIIAPSMETLGELWHAGEIPIAVEHFATHLCRNYLIRSLEIDPTKEAKGQIITACAPGEWHEIGILILTVLLRHRGWWVTYLGANLSLERFSEVLKHLKPQLVLFSASFPENAEALQGMVHILEKLKAPRPLIGLGGPAFLIDPTLSNRIPGTFFGPRADDAIDQIERLLTHLIKEE